jgi:streptogramin lyase
MDATSIAGSGPTAWIWAFAFVVTLLANIPAHAYDLVVSSDPDEMTSDQSDSLYRYKGPQGSRTGIIELPSTGGEANPFGVYSEPNKTVYVTSRGTNSILRLDKNNRFDTLVEANSGGLKDPFYIIKHRDGYLYVSSRGTNEIKRYDAETGEFVDNFVEQDAGGLKLPRGLRFGPDGNLYVNSSGSDQVLVYDGQTGAFIQEFQFSDPDAVIRVPCGLAFDRDGKRWNMCLGSAASPPEGLDPYGSAIAGGVACFDWASGERIARIPDKQTCGVDFGPDGRLYIAFAGSQKVGVYSLRDSDLRIFDEDIPNPRALAVAP